MVTQTDKPTDQQGEYSAICLFEGWKIEGTDLQYKHIYTVVEKKVEKKLTKTQTHLHFLWGREEVNQSTFTPS